MPLMVSCDVTSRQSLVAAAVLSDGVDSSGCELVKLYPARTQTTLYRVDVARPITDNAGKTTGSDLH